MRFITILTLTAAFCFCAMTGCSIAEDTMIGASEVTTVDTAESGEGENVQIPSPWTDCATQDELNAAAGTALHTPAGLEVSGEGYSYMNGDTYTLAQYVFTYNGGEYTLRTAPTQGDISGVYQDGKVLTELAGDDNDILATDDNALWSRWFDGDTQYSLYAANAAVEDYRAVRTLSLIHI